jgi:hypothetical protein
VMMTEMGRTRSRRFRSLCVGGTLVLLLLHPGLACDRGKATEDGESVRTRTAENEGLTPEEARAALIRMLGALQPDESCETDIGLDLAEYELRDLKTAKPRQISEDAVAFGSWRCDLAKRAWTCEVHGFSIEGGLSTRETKVCRRFCGVFRRQPGATPDRGAGQWEAAHTSTLLEETKSEMRSVSEKENLIAEEAKAALVRMVERPDSAFEEQPALRSAETEVIGEDQVAFGPMWTCDLKRKIWAFDVAFGEEDDISSSQHFVGIFYCDPTGQWEAIMTGGCYAD